MELSIKQIWALFKKDVLLEVRQQYAFYGVVLYVGATIFVLYMAIEHFDAGVWNGLFWIIQLFISINAVAKSFLQESEQRMMYYHTITNPINFILAKLLFNTVLMVVMNGLSLLLFSLFMGYPVVNASLFILLVFLGGWSLSLVFTMLAAIAARARQNAAIMAILGFPIIIPLLLMLMKLSGSVFEKQGSFSTFTLLIVLAMDLLIILLSIVLFPFLWKE